VVFDLPEFFSLGVLGVLAVRSSLGI